MATNNTFWETALAQEVERQPRESMALDMEEASSARYLVWVDELEEMKRSSLL